MVNTGVQGGRFWIILGEFAAPPCVEVKPTLQDPPDCRVSYDEQHGTGVVVCGALMSPCRATERRPGYLKMVVIGLGAAGEPSPRSWRSA